MGGRNGDYFNRKEKVGSLKKKCFLLVGFRLNALYAIFFVCLLLVYFLDFVIIFVLIYFCLQVVMLFRIWFLVVSSTDITWTEFV